MFKTVKVTGLAPSALEAPSMGNIISAAPTLPPLAPRLHFSCSVRRIHFAVLLRVAMVPVLKTASHIFLFRKKGLGLVEAISNTLSSPIDLSNG